MRRILATTRATSGLEYAILASVLGLTLVLIFQNFGIVLIRVFEKQLTAG